MAISKNGLAERKICDLQEHMQTALLCACNKWPGVITVHLWSYAMQHYNHVTNCPTQLDATLSPLELFSGTSSDTTIMTLSCIWLLSIHIGQCTAIWKRIT